MTRPEPAVKYSRLKRTHEKLFPFTREWNLSRFRGLSFLSNNDNNVNDNNNNKILIKREPLVYTRAQRAVQKNKKYNLG